MTLWTALKRRVARRVQAYARKAWIWSSLELLETVSELEYDEHHTQWNFTATERDRAHDFLLAALLSLHLDVRAWLRNQKSEAEIVRERLARRYDPGQALNEAFNRADEKVANLASTELRPGENLAQAQQRALGGSAQQPILHEMGSLELSSQQKAALKFQEEFLRRNMARSPKA